MRRKWKIIVLILPVIPYLFWRQIFEFSPILGGIIAFLGALYIMAGVGGAFRAWVNNKGKPKAK
jgi:ABC-type polysaccharide transport system permease subunit